MTAEPWARRTFTNAPPLSLDELTFRRDPFWQSLTRRRRRRLRGGKTQSLPPAFKFRPWSSTGPMEIVRGAPVFRPHFGTGRI